MLCFQVGREGDFPTNQWCIICIYIYIAGTQMTLVLVGKGLVLGGWPSKIEVIGALGTHTHTHIYIYIQICVFTWYWYLYSLYAIIYHFNWSILHQLWPPCSYGYTWFTCCSSKIDQCKDDFSGSGNVASQSGCFQWRFLMKKTTASWITGHEKVAKQTMVPHGALLKAQWI